MNLQPPVSRRNTCTGYQTAIAQERPSGRAGRDPPENKTGVFLSNLQAKVFWGYPSSAHGETASRSGGPAYIIGPPRAVVAPDSATGGGCGLAGRRIRVRRGQRAAVSLGWPCRPAGL